ncbi:uncharacterized protein LOC131433641 [Malaya genurostris]|uniref:uncharacterized protein LOC131433641 n=1 Tax=Malaya genurostris TaxID=325434 RepID=UPI0026F3E4D2|nr:uncharacterized protein LOC131433641 [Malaya genurostris]
MRCIVPGCRTDFHHRSRYSRHKFPLDVTRRAVWFKAILDAHPGNEANLMLANTEQAQICSLHFTSDCFTMSENRRRLTIEATPTIFHSVPKRPSSPTSGNQSACNWPCCQNRHTESHDKGNQTEDSGPLPDPVPIPLRYQDSCRLCFMKRDLEPLFSGLMVVREEMLQRIYACTGILIIPRPKKSMFICVKCGEMISAFYSFRQQTRSNNQALILRNELKLANANALREKSSLKKHKEHKKRKIVKPPPHPAKRNVKQLAPQPTQRIELIAKNILTSPVVTLEPNPLELPEEIKEEPMDSLELIDKTESCHFSETLKLEVSVDKVEYQPEWDIRKDPPEADDGKDSWNCWHCHQMYRFKFECAKHLLQEHREEVGTIRRQLQLDKLNYNMLEIMSERLSKVSTQ